MTRVPVVAAAPARCFFCGIRKHPRTSCPAREDICNRCHKKGHFAKVCKSNPTLTNQSANSSTAVVPHLAMVSSHGPLALEKLLLSVRIGNCDVKALFDSGTSESFIHPDVVAQCNLVTSNARKVIALAQSSSTAKITGSCHIQLNVNGQHVPVQLGVMPGLCSDVILGLDFKRNYQSITIHHGGVYPPLDVCGLTTLMVELPLLFANLTAGCHPIAAKSHLNSAAHKNSLPTK